MIRALDQLSQLLQPAQTDGAGRPFYLVRLLHHAGLIPGNHVGVEHRHVVGHHLLEQLDAGDQHLLEQWVGREKRILGAGELAHIPKDVVHGSYNVFKERAVFLAVLSPAVFDGPALIDVSAEEPWRSLRDA